jgi:hypothetical protein
VTRFAGPEHDRFRVQFLPDGSSQYAILNRDGIKALHELLGELLEIETMTTKIMTERLDLREKINRFNKDNPVGSRVRYWTGVREGDGILSKVRAPAEILGNHTAVVWVDGRSDCIALTHVQPHFPL